MAHLSGSERPLRILLSNHHLEVRAGSELVTLEVAEELSRRGHTVAVFTHHRGPLADEFQARTGTSVLTPLERAEIADWRPDVLHVHHWPTLAYLRSAGVTAPGVIGFLGVLPDLENPPPPDPGVIMPWWAVSEKVHENIGLDPAWLQMPNIVLRNWFDDREPRSPIPADVRVGSIAVVSNHFPAEAMDLLRQESIRRGIRVDHIGLPSNPRPVDATLLASYDAVVSLGRTAILAMSLGKPVLILDEHGADGWVTAESVDRIAQCNFSGRVARMPITRPGLIEWLDSPPTRNDLAAVQDWAWDNCRMTAAVDQLEQLYGQAQAGATQVDARPWHRVVGGYVQHIAALTGALEGLRRSLDEQVAAQRQLLDSMERARAEQADLLADLTGSASWRLTSPLRAAAGTARRARQRLVRGTDPAPGAVGGVGDRDAG